MRKETARRRVSHCPHRFTCPLVADEIAAPAFFAAPMEPGVVAAAPQDDSLEFTDAVVAEQWELEFGWPIFLFKQQPKRVLGRFFRSPIPSALNANAAINVERFTVIGINQFH